MKIQVTEDDIRGAGYGCYLCPVARALSRTLSIVCIVGIYRCEIKGKIFDLPRHVTAAIWRWDYAQFFEPMEFEIPYERSS